MKVFIFLFSICLFSEANSNYRLDDNLFFQFNRRDLEIGNRFQTSQSPQKFYITNKFYSTKGGNPSDRAREYQNQFSISPEFSLEKNNFYLIFSPNIKSSEKYNLVRERKSKLEPELVFGKEWKYNSIQFNLELGRGFIRFDSYGIFFNQISNYFEFSFQVKENFKISFLAFEKNKKTFEEKIGISPKFFGLSFLGKEFLVFKSFQVFYFQNSQPKQISEKRILEPDKEFIPKANYHYFGSEFKTKNFFENINFELGLFYQNGKKYLNEYSFQKENELLTKSGLIYFITNLDFHTTKFRLGGIYQRVKNKNSFEDNSFFVIGSNPRIFGGKSSILISESLVEQDRIEKIKNTGFQILNFSLVFEPVSYFQISFLLNQGRINDRYKGIEPILIFSILPTENLFFNISFSSAKLIDLKRNLSYNEFQLESEKLEFNRVYFSGGAVF